MIIIIKPNIKELNERNLNNEKLSIFQTVLKYKFPYSQKFQ